MIARTIARYFAVALMGLGVLVATADGFAQSYAGLYGWKADGFPLMVDLFIAVGELGLFLLAIDGHRLRRSFMAWLDLLVAASGWGASLTFNVGHVAGDFPTRATAAVPPLASMVGLLVLLRTLHRYVAQTDEALPRNREPVTTSGAVAPEDLVLSEAMEDTPPTLLAWLKSESEVRVPEPNPYETRAADEFADEVQRGKVPGIRPIKKRLRVGQKKAREVQAYLGVLVEREAIPAES